MIRRCNVTKNTHFLTFSVISKLSFCSQSVFFLVCQMHYSIRSQCNRSTEQSQIKLELQSDLHLGFFSLHINPISSQCKFSQRHNNNTELQFRNIYQHLFYSIRNRFCQWDRMGSSDSRIDETECLPCFHHLFSLYFHFTKKRNGFGAMNFGFIFRTVKFTKTKFFEFVQLTYI